MTEPLRYGKLSSEKLAEENHLCREIVREITNLNISQRQMLMLLYLLSLELEDVTKMKEISSVVRNSFDPNVFLVDQSEEMV